MVQESLGLKSQKSLKQGLSGGLPSPKKNTRKCLNQKKRGVHPNLLFLAFWVFLAFFLFKEVLAILSVFPFFPREFRGSASRRNPCLFGGFPCCFPKRQGKEDQGIKFLPAILGRKWLRQFYGRLAFFWFFLLENPHAHKIPPFRGGFWAFLEGGGGSANFIFMGVGIFPTKNTDFRTFFKGAQTMKCTLWTETLEFSRLKVPNSRFALHGLAPP